MGKSKFGVFIFLGAIIGGGLSFLHKPTRENVLRNSKKTISTIQYYGQNKDELKLKVQNEKEKYENLIGQITEEVHYYKEKLDDVRTLTPQVQELITQTKEAFNESKEEYKTLVSESTQEQPLGK